MTLVKKKIKVLFVIPTLRNGGAETQLISLVNNLSADVFEKHLLCFDTDLDQRESVDETAIKLHHYPRRFSYDISIPKKISEIIDLHEIDAVHCTLQIGLFMGWAGTKFSRKKPKVLVTLHTTVNRNIKNELFDWMLYQWLMRSCACVICVCQAQKEHWEKKWNFMLGQTKVIHNGIDTTYFSPKISEESGYALRDSLGIPESAKVIVHIAGFRVEKGHRVLLQAFCKALESEPDLYLLFAGGGLLRQEIELETREQHLENNVRFLGNIPDVRPVLTIANLSIIASTAVETFSIAMLESMAMEVPLVATDIGGTGEAVINRQTGYLVPVGDSEAIATAILAAFSDITALKEMGCRARQYIVDNFTAINMAKETEKIISKVVEGDLNF